MQAGLGQNEERLQERLNFETFKPRFTGDTKFSQVKL